MSTEPPVDSIEYAPPPPTATPPAAPPIPDGYATPYGEWGVIDPHDDALVTGASKSRWRWLPRSLTSRLVTGVVALVVVLVMATGVGTYLALKSFLYKRLDQQVSQA